jgi:decaprenylphospho-beta-D-ribofuranose 2-oxidase
VRGGRDSTEMLDRIDKIAIEHKAISSVYKDSRLTRDVVRRQYEGYDTFRDALHQYDPDRLFVTDLSERLGI